MVRINKNKNWLTLMKDNRSLEVRKYPKGSVEIIMDDYSGKRRKLVTMDLSRREASYLKKVV